MTDKFASRSGQCLRAVSLWHAHSSPGFINDYHLAQALSAQEEGRRRRNPINSTLLFFSLGFVLGLSHRGRFSEKLMETKLTSPSFTFTQREIYCCLWWGTFIFMSFFFFFVSKTFFFTSSCLASCLPARTHAPNHGDRPSPSSARSDAEQTIFFFLCKKCE